VSLSGHQSAEVHLAQILPDDGETEWEDVVITISDFVNAAGACFERLFVPINKVLAEKNVSPSECRYLVVGGSAPISFLGDFLAKLFGKPGEVLNDRRGAIARGACFCAAQLKGLHPKTARGDELEIVEVAPHSIGQQCINDVFAEIIPKGTHLPCTLTRSFWTVADNQTRIAIKIFEGENPVASANLLLSNNLMVENLPPKPKGQAGINVTLAIDLSGICTVKGEEQMNASNQVQGTIDTGAQRECPIAWKLYKLGQDDFKAILTPAVMHVVEYTVRSVKIELLAFHAQAWFKSPDVPLNPTQRAELEPVVAKLKSLASDPKNPPSPGAFDEIESQVFRAVKLVGSHPIWIPA
jgi:molecular chaperone DnaK (HSP70)